LSRLHDFDIGPAIGQQFVASGGNGGILSLPELPGIGKNAILPEQVGNDLALVAIEREQGMSGRNRRAAEQPRLELRACRAMIVVAVEQGKPRFLLRLGGKGEMADARRIDIPIAVKIADAGQRLPSARIRRT
jgi:hypothetical protein